MDEQLIFTVEESGDRIDALLPRHSELLSRSAAQRLIEEGRVFVNGRPAKKNDRVGAGDLVEALIPAPADIPLVPQDIPLDVVYEDGELIVVNKPRGLVVHPAPGHPDGTLVNALLWHCGDSLSGVGGEKRPGIVHRIDRDTSGLLVAAKNDAAHRALALQLADHSLFREYEAVVRGAMREDGGVVRLPIGRSPTDRKRMAVNVKNGREAVTHWQVLERYRGYTRLLCRLETGRTHQIRVHMAAIGHPLLGDGVYGAPSPDKGLEGQCLHARRLHLTHPVSGERLAFEAPLPPYFTEVLSRLVKEETE
ncbi:MAG: RluA family pseudouridine synthase [Oscillospiraceae bacterium]|nr:RluA family pseudouridine synthase [Oscillospiraceae bacterium]